MPGGRAGPRAGRAAARAAPRPARAAPARLASRDGSASDAASERGARVQSRARARPSPRPPAYGSLPTERANRRARDLDRLSALQIARLMNREDRRPAEAVGRVLPAIARAVDLIVAALRSGGRLFFVGAG